MAAGSSVKRRGLWSKVGVVVQVDNGKVFAELQEGHACLEAQLDELLTAQAGYGDQGVGQCPNDEVLVGGVGALQGVTKKGQSPLGLWPISRIVAFVKYTGGGVLPRHLDCRGHAPDYRLVTRSLEHVNQRRMTALLESDQANPFVLDGNH